MKILVVFHQLLNIIKQNQDHPTIRTYEKLISKSISSVIQYEEFYKLPISSILSIVSQTPIKDKNSHLKTMQTIIQNTVKYHPKRSILLLSAIQTTNITLTTDEIYLLLKKFTNSELINYKIISSQQNPNTTTTSNPVQQQKPNTTTTTNPVQQQKTQYYYDKYSCSTAKAPLLLGTKK